MAQLILYIPPNLSQSLTPKQSPLKNANLPLRSYWISARLTQSRTNLILP